MIYELLYHIYNDIIIDIDYLYIYKEKFCSLVEYKVSLSDRIQKEISSILPLCKKYNP